MKKWIAGMLSLMLLLSLCGCELTDILGTLNIMPGNQPSDSQPSDSQSAGEHPENKDVTVPMMTGFAIIHTDEDGNQVQMNAVIEYDDEYNLVSFKGYTGEVLQLEITFGENAVPLVQQYYDEEGNPGQRYVSTYDENGRELSYYAYDADGNVSWGTVYTYDEAGNVLTDISYDSDGSVSWSTAYTYDENGNVLTETDEEGTVTHFVYDADGNLEKSYYVYKELEFWTTYTYDSHGNMLSQTSGCGDEIDRERTWQYTYSGETMLELKEFAGDELCEHEQYNADGQIILSVSYDDGQEYSRYTYAYDARGNRVETVTFWDGEEVRRTVSTYDENDVITGMKEYSKGVLTAEVTPTYQTVTVPAEIAKQIEMVHSLIYMF